MKMDTDTSSDPRSELSPVKRALLEQRLRGLSPSRAKTQNIPRRRVTSPAPVTLFQRRLLIGSDFGKKFTFYLANSVRLGGALNVSALQRSLDELVKRHESLRTTFDIIDGQYAQVINPIEPAILPVIDLRTLPEEKRQAEARRLASEELARPFDLTRGPLMRMTVMRLEDQEHVMLLIIHHMISDSLSINVLTQELMALYEAYSNGLSSPLPELPIQYADWVVWEQERLRSEEVEKQFSYWRQQLAGCPQQTQLPFARPRPAEQNFRGEMLSLSLSAELSNSLRELSRSERVSLYTTLLAAFKALVFRYTGRSDLLVGKGIAGRNRLETEKLIGCFINLLPMRTDLSGNPTCQELLRRVQKVVEGAFANQDIPFDLLIEGVEPEPGCPPLVQLVFNLYDAREAHKPENLSLSAFDFGKEIDYRFIPLFLDMILGMLDTPRGLVASLKYNPDLFDEAAVKQMLEDYKLMLESFVAHPQRSILESGLNQ
jgi:non-ribosomal peptide synthetase component F